MSLKLTIQSINGSPCVEQHSVHITEEGGSIGRSDKSSLVLMDEEKLISRCHAKIECVNGQYKLVENSLAGTYIDDAIEPINNVTIDLADAMALKIGAYVILVNLVDTANDDEQQSDNETGYFDSFLVDDHENNDHLPVDVLPFGEAGLIQPVENNSILDSLSPASVDPLRNEAQNDDFSKGLLSSPANNLLDEVSTEAPHFDTDLLAENISSLNDSYIPPVSEPDPNLGVMPEDFNFEDLFDEQPVDKPMPVPAAKPIEPAVEDISYETKEVPVQAEAEKTSLNVELVEDALLSTASMSESEPLVVEDISPVIIQPSHPQENPVKQNNLTNTDFLQSFLRGAGMENEKFDLSDSDKKISDIGAMFRQFVESTVAVLRSRAEFKSLFRVTVTTIKRADNNPLKFAVTTNEALKHLLNDGQGGFKPSVESIDEGFNDLLNHQLAMQAGIQASLAELLHQFNPATIEKQYEEGLVLQKKSKCWEKYNRVYDELSETAVEDFFGDAFSVAYEKQMKQLKP